MAGIVRTAAGTAVVCIAAARRRGCGRVLPVNAAAGCLAGRVRRLLALVASRAADPAMAAAVFDAVDVHLCTPPQPVPLYPADADLALFLALASLFSGRPLPPGVAAAARVDRDGRLQPGCTPQASLDAAAQVGSELVVLPRLADEPALSGRVGRAHAGLRCCWLNTVDEALHWLLVRDPGAAHAQTSPPGGRYEGDGHG